MTRATRVVALALLAVAAASGAMYLRANSPENPQKTIYLSCPFHAMTGWRCAGCGTTRALHHLLNGRAAEAFRLNPLLFTLAPLLGSMAMADLLLRRRGEALSAGWLYAAAASIALTMVARNLLDF